jgi:hypothetical protein
VIADWSEPDGRKMYLGTAELHIWRVALWPEAVCPETFSEQEKTPSLAIPLRASQAAIHILTYRLARYPSFLCPHEDHIEIRRDRKMRILMKWPSWFRNRFVLDFQPEITF